MDIEKIIRFAQSLDQSRGSVEELYAYLLEVFGLDRPLERDFQKRGILITFDGHSGTGKDTQMQKLVGKMNKDESYDRYNIVSLIQKRNDPFRQVAKHLWENPALSSGGDCSFLLLTAGRRYFTYSGVFPKLEDPNNIVIQNRSYLSHVAYHASDPAELSGLLAVCDFDPRVDLPFILDCDVDIAYRRVQARSPEKGGIVYPNERPDYIVRVQRNFEGLERFVDGLVFIDTSRGIEAIAGEIKSHVDIYLTRANQK